MPQREFTGFGGIKLVADEYGSRDLPSVVLLGGAAQSRKLWRHTAQALADAGRHVVSLDLRGHGDSDWAKDERYDLDAFVGDLYAVLRDLSSRPVIVGSSLGGRIATVALGEGGPDLATALILVNAPAEYDLAGLSDLNAEMKEHYGEGSELSNLDPAFQTPRQLSEQTERIEKAAEALKLPALLVRGERNPVSSAESIEKLAGQIGDSEIVEIPGGRHLLAVEHAEPLSAALVEFLERRVPREAPEYVAGSDPRTLRDALGCFATGITVVTATGADGQNVGFTANSFTSVSLDPPLLLVCPAKTASAMAVLEQAEHFAVNVLHIGQQPVSNAFASKVEDRFAGLDWECWDHGVPIIKGSLASFECSKYAEYDGGDHVILVGEVKRVRYEPQRDPLLYFRGKYRRLHFA